MAYIYVGLFWHTCLLLLGEVDVGRADFLGDVEAFQQSHTDLLGHGVQRLDVAWDLCRTISGFHFIGLDRLHCCQKKNMSITWGDISSPHLRVQQKVSEEIKKKFSLIFTMANILLTDVSLQKKNHKPKTV